MLLPNDGDLFVVYTCFCFEVWHVLRHMLNDAQNTLLMYGFFQGDHLESIISIKEISLLMNGSLRLCEVFTL